MQSSPGHEKEAATVWAVVSLCSIATCTSGDAEGSATCDTTG